MEHNIELFNNPEFKDVHYFFDEDDNPWFVGKDIALVLGYKNPTDAVNNHVDECDRKVLKYKVQNESLRTLLWSGNDYSDKVVINESGYISLIMQSKLPKAKTYKRWVTHDVLPSIFKTGSYSTTQQQPTQIAKNNQGEAVIDSQYVLAIAKQMVAQSEAISE